MAATLPHVVSPQQTYLERARTSIVEAVAAAGRGENATEHLPAKSLAYFDRFGRGLREGESIGFSRGDGAELARLTPQTRRRLVLSAPGVQFITDDAMRRGAVVGTNDADRTFTIRLANGQEVQAPLTPEHRDVVLDAQKEAPGGVRVAVRGVGRFNRSEKLVGFDDVEDVTPLEPLDVPARLDELQMLKSGWLNGDGRPLNPMSLDRLRELFTAYYPNELPLPYTFPTEGGGVQFEWRIEGNTPEIEIDLASFRSEWLSGDDEATIDLNLPEGWTELAQRLGELTRLDQNEEVV